MPSPEEVCKSLPLECERQLSANGVGFSGLSNLRRCPAQHPPLAPVPFLSNEIALFQRKAAPGQQLQTSSPSEQPSQTLPPPEKAFLGRGHVSPYWLRWRAGFGISHHRSLTVSTRSERGTQDSDSGSKSRSKGGYVESKRGDKYPEVNAEEVMRELEAELNVKDKKALTAEERNRINKFLRHFQDSGWAADQALSIYINSSFFPTAASKFRKFVLRAITDGFRDLLLGRQAQRKPSAESDALLFPIFAEFCFNNFAGEIKAYRDLVNSADMTKPHTWYPYTRALKRRIIYHMGPTNSGKTHQALVRFKEASSGLYCGPLRLLAMEVFDRVNADGVYCNLITGQERKEMPFANHTACTVEMANLFKPVDVAIIDEIQMMNDEYRGWAWTRALLGVQATEVHVCGDPSALGVLQAMCQATGDVLLCSSYARFAPLTVDTTSLKSDISNIRPGDCIVAFSRREIFEIKRQVELIARQRCCVVYGALPPETRRQQALLFNKEGSGFDVLVASDAVGMGLNLNIRRMVFSTLYKFNGESKGIIPPSMVKQIAGRAGRRGSMYEEGVVTCLHPGDIPLLVDALQQNIEPMTEVGLFPVFEQVELFASKLPEMTFSQLLNRFVETSRVDGQYFICKTDNLLRIASMLDRVEGLSLKDRFFFCFAPTNTRDTAIMNTLLQYAESFSQEQPVKLNLPRTFVFSASAAAAAAHAKTGKKPTPLSQFSLQLIGLEGQHQVASLYLWLAQHFSDEMFPDKQLAVSIAQGTAEQLAATLLKPAEDAAPAPQKRLRWRREQVMEREVESQKGLTPLQEGIERVKRSWSSGGQRSKAPVQTVKRQEVPPPVLSLC